MFRSSASLMAEDVTVKCRVRRSKYAHTFESSTEPMEMACTMRNWEGQSYYKSRRKSLLSLTAKAAGNCPEILLTPIEYHGGGEGGGDDIIDGDDDDNQLSWPCSISMDDILVVQRHYPASANDAKLSITTMQAGSYELGGLTANGHDILLAFLQASLEPERICFADHDNRAVTADGYGGGGNNNDHSINTFCQENNQNIFSSGSSVSSCLDFDTLQDMHVQNCANAETWPEKMSRRFGRVVHNLTETFSDNCCAAVVPTSATDAMDHSQHQQRSRHYPQHHQQRDDVPSLACAPRADALFLSSSSPPPRSPAAHTTTTTTTTTPTLFVSQRPGSILYELERANSGSTNMTGGNMNNNNNNINLAGPSKIWKMPSGLSVESEADQSSVLPLANHHHQQHHHYQQQQQLHNKKKSRSFI